MNPEKTYITPHKVKNIWAEGINYRESKARPKRQLRKKAGGEKAQSPLMFSDIILI